MDDLNGKIGALLADPESMKNLRELAEMLGVQKDTPAAPVGEVPDIGRLAAIGQALGSGEDARAALILALRPYLSAERAARAEKAAKRLRLWKTVSVLRESGMLDEML